jgi:hypothetical protein
MRKAERQILPDAKQRNSARSIRPVKSRPSTVMVAMGTDESVNYFRSSRSETGAPNFSRQNSNGSFSSDYCLMAIAI